VLGADLAVNDKAPLAETASRLMGNAGRILVLIGATVSTFGFVGGDILCSPRAVYALGRDGLLPSAFGRIHDRFRTPHIAIVTHAALCAAFAVTGSFNALLVLSVLSALIVYLICCLAAIQLQRKNIRVEGSIPYKVPGGRVVPVLAAAIVIWLMSSSTAKEFVALAITIAVLTLVYFLMRARRVAVSTAS
jgi:amino acid transporter